MGVALRKLREIVSIDAVVKKTKVSIGHRAQLLLVLFRDYGLDLNYWRSLKFQIVGGVVKFKFTEIHTNNMTGCQMGGGPTTRITSFGGAMVT